MLKSLVQITVPVWDGDFFEVIYPSASVEVLVPASSRDSFYKKLKPFLSCLELSLDTAEDPEEFSRDNCKEDSIWSLTDFDLADSTGQCVMGDIVFPSPNGNAPLISPPHEIGIVENMIRPEKRELVLTRLMGFDRKDRMKVRRELYHGSLYDFSCLHSVNVGKCQMDEVFNAIISVGGQNNCYVLSSDEKHDGYAKTLDVLAEMFAVGHGYILSLIANKLWYVELEETNSRYIVSSKDFQLKNLKYEP